MTEEGFDNTAVISSKKRREGKAAQYLTNFEDSFCDCTGSDVLYQRKMTYNLVRLVDVLRGEQSISSLSDSTMSKLSSLGEMAGVDNIPYSIPSYTGFKSRKYDKLVLFLGQIYEIRVLDTLNWRNKTIILYIADAWEPKLKQLSELIVQYNIDIVFCSFRESADRLSSNHDNVFWLPQAINPNLWRDYGLDKKSKFIQFGRENPRLKKFAIEFYGKDEYVSRFIHGDINLAKKINQSKFCLVSPRQLQSPEITGDISPVTLRYYQAMGCKSLPAGFKPKEFDDIFSDNVHFVEYNNKNQFRNDIEYHSNNKEIYDKKVTENYELVRKNHTWSKRAQKMADIVSNYW